MVYTVGAHTSINVNIDSMPLRSLIWYAEKVKSDLDDIKRQNEINAQKQGSK